MTRQRTITRWAATALLMLAAFPLPACKGSNTTTSSGPVAAFTADTPVPTDGTIALLSGSTAGAAVNVRVTVTGVPSFFGAAFRIKYDTTALLFNTMSTSGSFLTQGVMADDVFFLEDHTTVPGEVIVTATRKDPTVAGPIDVAATSDLLVLNFVARKAIVAGAAEGRLDFIDPREVCNGTVSPPGCGAIAVAWSGGGLSAQ